MAFTVDYQPFAAGAGADVESQAQFLLDLADPGQLQNGYVTGVANSAQFNKVARQSSMIATCVANFISQQLQQNVLDDGNVPALIINFTNAILAAVGNPFSTGDLKPTLKTVADAGWVLCDDGTIGNAASGATSRANADTAALFTLLWTNISNANAPVLPGGHGASAAADFAANKTIGLTKMLGRALALAGAGALLTARTLGSSLGEEAHALTAAEGPTHTHAINDPGHVHALSHVFANGELGAIDAQLGNPNHAATAYAVVPSTDAAATGVAVLATGNGTAHNTMQPTSFVNIMVKL